MGRSAPFRLLQLAEGLLLLSFAMLAAAGVCAVMYSRSPADEVQLKMPELPAKYQLLQHAQLCLVRGYKLLCGQLSASHILQHDGAGR